MGTSCMLCPALGPVSLHQSQVPEKASPEPTLDSRHASSLGLNSALLGSGGGGDPALQPSHYPFPSPSFPVHGSLSPTRTRVWRGCAGSPGPLALARPGGDSGLALCKLPPLVLRCCWVRLFVTPWTVACQTPLSTTISQSLLTLMSIESVMPSNHLILCYPLLLLPSISPRIRVFSNELALPIKWPKY